MERQPNKHIQKCENFKREFVQFRNPNGIQQREVQFCKIKGTDMRCGGFSDGCPPQMQEFFIASDNISRDVVLFDTTELDERIRQEDSFNH